MDDDAEAKYLYRLREHSCDNVASVEPVNQQPGVLPLEHIYGVVRIEEDRRDRHLAFGFDPAGNMCADHDHVVHADRSPSTEAGEDH